MLERINRHLVDKFVRQIGLRHVRPSQRDELARGLLFKCRLQRYQIERFELTVLTVLFFAVIVYAGIAPFSSRTVIVLILDTAIGFLVLYRQKFLKRALPATKFKLEQTVSQLIHNSKYHD